MLQVRDNEVEIDRLARVMAANAGHVWDLLEPYPGYQRGRFRSEARALLRRIQTGDLPCKA